MRSAVISNYQKDVEGNYRQHHKEDFNDAVWVEYFTKPKKPGSVFLIKGDSLVRILTRIPVQWLVGILVFSGAAMPQTLASPEVRKITTVTMMTGTNDVSNNEASRGS